MGIGIIIGLLAAIISAYIIYRLLKAVWALVVNGIVGLAAFWLLGALGIIHISMDLWTFLIAAIGGLPGVLVVVVLAYFGVPL
ncbi:MAG: pro-sigmaK processing inhibitor BofA family protein [Candidatus ainarchaeum sp.]|nr:pro-sigmaK processing inhibitor BofA family protein [Candidatus ainarchaeum sp.]